MIGTVQIWDALIERLKELLPNVAVRAYPAERIETEDFFEHIPDLRPPFVLVIFRGREKLTQGAASTRTCDWGLLFVFEDLRGEAYRENLARVEMVADTLEDEDLSISLEEGTVWLLPDQEISVKISTPGKSVYLLEMQSREDVERE